MQRNIPLTRLFFLDPFGSTDPDDLKNFGSDVTEHNYIFMHDQEPIDLALHRNLFDDAVSRNKDLDHGRGARQTAIIVSEIDSDNLDAVCQAYDWRPFYYFFHGWASLDWYRGYNQTFLITPPHQRTITHSFLSPNRIMGGQRDHRPLLMYHLLKQQVQHALISCPLVCPVEKLPITSIVKKFEDRYPDIVDTFDRANLPWHFAGENHHPMHSCWLSLFDQSAQSLAYVVTETVYFGRRSHITEKTFKPICLGMPFVMASAQGSLAYLRRYGFQTFGDFWDESYDDEQDDFLRLERIGKLLGDLDRMVTADRQALFHRMLPTIKHNYHHFYGGAFERVLWEEFQHMLRDIKLHFSQS